MKKNKNYLLIAALAVACTAVCSTGITAAIVFAKQDYNPDTAALTPEQYDQWTDTWSKPGHLYFHYNRGDKQGYENYALWLWPFEPNSLEGTLWGFGRDPKVSPTLTLKPMSRSTMSCKDVGLSGGNTQYLDKYGAIYDVDYTSTNLVGGKTGESVSFEGSTSVGFLLPRVDSMNGEKNWESDGGTEVYISDIQDGWRNIKDGQAIHIYVSTGKLDEHAFSVSGWNPEPVPNPMDDENTGAYDSTQENIGTYVPTTGSDGITSTSEAFKDVGVGYQIFVASFRDSNGDGIGDINGIRQSLDYLEDLGAQCLWLTPVMKSGSYHGYDVIDYTDIDKRFGTMEDFENLLTEAHAKGMKVLMDLVLNHTSKNNVWFKKSQWGVNSGLEGTETDDTGINWRDVYTWRFHNHTFNKLRVTDGNYTPGVTDPVTVENDALSDGPSWFRNGESNYFYYGKFGSGMPEINYQNQATRNLVIDTAKFWLAKGVDGYRLDAVKHIYMNDESDQGENDAVIYDVGTKRSYDDEKGKYVTKPYDYSSNITKNVNWWKEFADKLKQEYPNCFLVGENFDGWGTRTANYYQALDSQFDFSNYYHVPAWIYNTDAGASSFDTTEDNGGQAWETYIPFSNDLTYDVKAYKLDGSSIAVQGGKRTDFINGAFTSNHDVMRLINQANGVGNKDNTVANDNVEYNNPWINGRAKFQAAVTLLNPGLSWIYYGDELGMSSNTYQHIEKYGSENNMDIWYRQPFLWKEKSARTGYKANQYKFELDAHNRHLLNNDEGIDTKVTVDENDPGKIVSSTPVKTLSTFYPYYKVLTTIKKAYPVDAKIEFKYSSKNVLRIDVKGQNSRELVIFLNNGHNDNEYRIMLDSSYTHLASTEGAPTQINGDIGKSIFGVTAFYKGVK